MSDSARARRRHLRVSVLACALAAGMPISAHGQASHRAEAEVLFREARKLVDEGRFAEGCAKFAASQKVEAAVGTLLNLGRCYEKINRTATAWATYHEAVAVASATGQSEREKIAKERADTLEPTLPHLTIAVPAQPATLQLSIRRDGEAVLPEVWGVTVPVDPGEHVVEASATGKKPWSTKIRVDERQRATVVVPPMDAEDSLEAQSVAADVLVPSAAAGSAPEVTAAPSTGWSAGKTAAIVLAGAGLAGVALATVEGLRVLDMKAEFGRECPGGACREPEHSIAQATLDGAQKARTVSIVAGIGGGVCVLGAAVLWLSAGHSAASADGRIHLAPIADDRQIGLGVNGRW